MNRIFGIFIAFLLIPTLPAFGVSNTDAGRQRQEIETKYCIQIAGAGGGTLNCATQSLNCIYGLKPAYTKEQVDKIVTEYCETIGFAAASATQNASSGLLLATPAQEDERAAKQEGNKTTTKTCPKITAEWKKQNNATAGACDTTTGELYITECKPDYVGATRGIGKDGYKSCTASNLTKIGEKCDTENATSAKYAQVNGSVVCQPTKCKCGYELSNNKCNAWTETSEQCSANNAITAKYICENDKKVCTITKCLDTHYLDADKNKCIAKSTVKCTQYEDVDDTGKCVAKLDADRSKAEHQESCRNTNGEWTDDNKCKCKKGYKPVDGDPYACEPTKKTATNEEKKQLCEKNGAGKWTDKNKCECTNPAYSFIDDQGCQPDDKKTEHEKHKALCKSPNEWNDRTHKCNCKNTKEFFDEETGCTAATPKFIEAQKEIEKLKSQLETTITELNK